MTAVIFENETVTPLTPSGVLTPRLLEGIEAFRNHPFRDRIIEVLRNAEKEIFVPFLTGSTPASFAQQFQFLALKFTPMRLVAAIWFAQGIGPDFPSTYLNAVQAINNRLIADSWGVPRAEFANTLHQYFSSVKLLLASLPKLGAAPTQEILQLISPISEVDFGLTSLTLAFEGEISTSEWVVLETFKLTRRALLDYEQAITNISAQIDDPVSMERVLAELRPETSVDQPTSHDLKSTYRRYDPPR